MVGKYTVIVMRDDADVRRFRAGPGILRFFVYLMTILVLAAAGGIFGAYRFHQNEKSLEEEKRGLELRLGQLGIKLERLQNIERILSSNDPSELKTLLSTIVPEAQQRMIDREGTKEADKAAAEPDAAVAAKSPLEGIAKVDAGIAALENVTIRFDAKGMTIGFGLKNLNPQSTISGAVQISLVSLSGQLIDVAPKEELNYQIQRFKQMSAVVQFPPAVDKKDVAGFRLMVNNTAGKTVFSDTYPFPQN